MQVPPQLYPALKRLQDEAKKFVSEFEMYSDDSRDLYEKELNTAQVELNVIQRAFTRSLNEFQGIAGAPGPVTMLSVLQDISGSLHALVDIAACKANLCVHASSRFPSSGAPLVDEGDVDEEEEDST
ncbi:MAG: hypothetical protein M1837_001399 [Sclerophora amabilis]|nr:MAG: hypothetical protein M1837_001399 [Sclerophora amabilis]